MFFSKYVFMYNFLIILSTNYKSFVGFITINKQNKPKAFVIKTWDLHWFYI